MAVDPTPLGRRRSSVGVQLIGRHGRDIEVLQVARLVDELLSFNAACPPLVAGGAL